METSSTLPGGAQSSDLKQDSTLETVSHSEPMASELGEPIVASMSQEDLDQIAREVDLERLETYLLSKHAASVQAQKYHWADPRHLAVLLTHPSPELSALHVRRRARLLSIVCIIFFIISVVSNAMSYANHEPFPGVRAVHTLLNVCIPIAYFMSRLSHFQYGADIITFGTWLLCLVHMCADLAADKEDYHTMSSFYTWLYTPAWMFFAVLFGTPMRVVGLLVLDVISLLNMPAFTNTTFGAMPRILLMHASCDMAIALSVIIHARDMLQLNEAPLPENSDEEAMHEAMRKPEGLIARIFYAPSDLLLNRAQRRRSRVLSAMLLYLMLTGGAWAYLHSKLGDIPDEFASAIGGWIGCCAVLYLLSRTVFTHYAAILTVIGVYLVPFTVVWSNHASLEATLPLYLTHSTLAALLATMILEGWEMMVLGLLFLIPTFFANVAPFPPTSIITILLVACSIITFLDLRDLKRLERVQRQSIAAKHPIWFGDHSNTTSKLLKQPKMAYWVFGVLISSLILLNFISMGSDVSASRAPIVQYDVTGLRTAQNNDVDLASAGVTWTLQVTTDKAIDSSQQYIITSDSITEFVNRGPLGVGVTTFHFSATNIRGPIKSIGVWLLGGGAQYSQTATIRSLNLEDLSSQTVYVWPPVDTNTVPMAETSRTAQGRVTADNYEVSSGYVQWSPLSAPLLPAGFADSQQMTALWNEYVAAYGLTNWTPEDFTNFVANVKLLLNQNERITTALGQLTRYSHLNLATFQQQRMGLQTPTDAPMDSPFTTESVTPHPTAEYSVQAVPASWDWRTLNGVTAIQDQGQCGSCWAFAGSAAMESSNLISNGDGTILGPQEYVDCCTGTGYYSQGCNGGQFTEPFKWGIAAGTCTKASYPYNAVQGTCKTAGAGQCTELSRRPVTYASVPSGGSEAAVQTALMTRPLVIGVAADSWSPYRSGVHTDCSGAMNHAVLLIGWGTDPTYGDYWLIKNSWNTWWGESGFIRLKRDGACGCFVCSYVYQVAYAASCPAKTGPAYSVGSCPITPAGSSCSSIGCQYGIASGTFTITCNAGSWSTIGTCNPPPGCPAIGAPTYGSGSCGATPHGGTCAVSCTNGVVSGSTTLTCNAGTWSTVQCRGPPCAALSAPAYGTGSCPSTADGASCSGITCTYGPASSTITCTAGTWSSLSCNAPASCAAFSAPAYATAGCGVTAHGGTCSTPCQYGAASGSTTRTCNNGVWSALTCNAPPPCALLSAPQYGTGSCAASAHGTVCSSIVCTYGVQGGGSASMTCNAGTWTPTITCLAPQPCAAIGAPTWGAGSCPQTAHQGTCTTQTCTYGPSGTQTRTCNNGVWSTLTCTVPAACAAMGAPYDGSGDCPAAAHGSVCNQQCYHGVATGSQDRTCDNGVWSPLVCQAPCSALNPPQYGSGWCLTTSDGGSCQQNCLYGAPTSGSTVRTCSGGQWSALVCPTGASCAALTAPQDGSGTCPITQHGGTCTQSCTNGLAVNGGSMTRTCNNGVWSDLTCAASATTAANCVVQWNEWGGCQAPCQYDWVLLAKTDGASAISSSFYTTSSGSAAGANYAAACSQFDLVTYPNAVLRVTMGSIVDYIKAAPGKSVCDVLTTSGAFLYSPSLDGPFIAPTPYGSLLGGSASGWPASAYGAANDARAYVSFWGGAPSSNGGCCYDTGTKGQPGAAAWGKAFAIHLLVLPGTQTRTATITTPPSGTGTPCPALTQTQSCICPVDGGWGAFSGTCPAQCNGGVLARSCNNPAPAYGGAPCGGFDWAYCASTPCSATAAVITVVLNAQKSNMTHDDLPAFEAQITNEISAALSIPSGWISVLNVDVRGFSSVAVQLAIDNGNSSAEQNAALVNALSDMINDPTSNLHLPQLFPLMAGSTVDSGSSSAQPWQFYVEVVFGTIAGVIALVAIIYLSVWMYKRYKEDGESDQKWNKMGTSKEDKWEMNPVASSSPSSYNSSLNKPAHDTGGLNTQSYGYTNPVASSPPQHRSTPSLPNRSPSPPAPLHRPANSYGGGPAAASTTSSYSQMPPAPPARTATNTTNSSNGSARAPPPAPMRSPSPTPAGSASPRSVSPVAGGASARAPPPKPTGSRPGSPTAGGRAPPPKPAGAPARNAPGNWVKKYDPAHKHYYYWNKVTNVSQWNMPAGFVE